MRLAIMLAALGVSAAQFQAELAPARAITAAVLAGAAWCAAFAWRSRADGRRLSLVLIGAFCAGYAWASGYAAWRLADALAPRLEGQDVVVTGVVAGLPQNFERGTRFDFEVESAPSGVPRHLLLAWYRSALHEDAEEQPAWRGVRAGERWRFTVKLKQPHGLMNPHGFDYEAWLFVRGVRATGYVRGAAGAERLAEFVWRPALVVERLRELLRSRYQGALPDAPYAGVLVALALGDQHAIPPAQWQVFARTGLTHLMSISGLHITMVAGLVYSLIWALWVRLPRLVCRYPARLAAALGGWCAAGAYSLLAGFEVPAQRTFYMLSVVALALLAGRAQSLSRVLALALGVVLVLDPSAVLAPGTWLSFGAVGFLTYAAAGRTRRPHWFAEWLRAQWAVTLGGLPILLLMFQQFSVVSPLANAVTIPAISLVVTPLVLAAAVLPADLLLQLAHLITALTMSGVERLAALPAAVWQQHAPPLWAAACGVAGCVLLLLPRGLPGRGVGLVLLAPMLLVLPARPQPGDMRVTVLDVGQGLAVHVATATHDLLFDSGPRYGLDTDAGNRVILPYLRAEGVRRLDMLTVSHRDRDHSGGMNSVLAALPVAVFASSLAPAERPAPSASRMQACSDGLHWEWDGVRFDFLHPAAASYARTDVKSNDMGCVLRVAAAGGTALIAADIEAVSEGRLLALHRGELAADLLVAPHHGSRTSSTPEFIAAVAPRAVVFTVGYKNRFRHPAPDVVERYRTLGTALARSDYDGAVRADFSSAGMELQALRSARRRYWQALPPEGGPGAAAAGAVLE
ncbi:MAG: DNA internalization-related competence protein ComEC/Rec2 [Rhodocyclaceae bacterium]|nr:DNA internalization-related competence protein ComEC/Rec2 [Rhodocyclaceae bacterium]MBX3667802.1 DNA internalization-related competence protein ComEC/Rec2 [Rhodocyclaceae bacterium]